MKKVLFSLMGVGLCLGLVGMAMADNSDTQSVSTTVSAINEITVSGNPGGLTVSIATAGSEPTAVNDTSTTYSITTNCGDDAKRITAGIDEAMPVDITFMITLAAPSGAVSSGAKDISAAITGVSALDVVTLIDAVASSGHLITYELSATVDAGVVATIVRTVTLTIIDT